MSKKNVNILLILFDDNMNNSKKLTNCFDKFPGNNFSEVKRNGLILSVIRQVI